MGIMVSTVKYLVLTTLEELENPEENTNKLVQPLTFNVGDGDNMVLLDDTFHNLGGEEEEEEDKSDF